MIHISDEAFLRTTLKKGTVYYYISEKIDSNEPHYHIVIHKAKSKRIILGLTTTQIDKRIKFLGKINYQNPLWFLLNQMKTMD